MIFFFLTGHVTFQRGGDKRVFYESNEIDPPLYRAKLKLDTARWSRAHFNYHSQRRGIYSHANCVRRQY